MTLASLTKAVARQENRAGQRELRSLTYLATYPYIRSAATATGTIDRVRFCQLACMVYGWMPRVLRIDLEHIERAMAAVAVAPTVTEASVSAGSIESVAACLHSLVGASKVLHFANDQVFPIWDSRIEGFRLGKTPTQTHMSDLTNYLAYFVEVHSIRHESGFGVFRDRFTAFANARLRGLGIPIYAVSDVRAIESTAFELTVQA